MNRAFSDYALPMDLTLQQFKFMMRQRGLDKGASRVAVVDGKIVAVWLGSIRNTASYLISSGTDPAHRRKGLARKLATDCLSDLKFRGAISFHTEVLTGKLAHSIFIVLLACKSHAR